MFSLSNYQLIILVLCSSSTLFAMEAPPTLTEFIPSKENCGTAVRADGFILSPPTISDAVKCFEAGFLHFYETDDRDFDQYSRSTSANTSHFEKLNFVILKCRTGLSSVIMYDEQGKDMAAYTLWKGLPCLACESCEGESRSVYSDLNAQKLQESKTSILSSLGLTRQMDAIIKAHLLGINQSYLVDHFTISTTKERANELVSKSFEWLKNNKATFLEYFKGPKL